MTFGLSCLDSVHAAREHHLLDTMKLDLNDPPLKRLRSAPESLIEEAILTESPLINE